MGEVLNAFKEIHDTIGTAWDDVICVCRGLIKDEPCECNCKEFHDESLTNSHKEKLSQEGTKTG